MVKSVACGANEYELSMKDGSSNPDWGKKVKKEMGGLNPGVDL